MGDEPYRVEYWRTYSGKPRCYVRGPDGEMVGATAGSLTEGRVVDLCKALNAAYHAGAASAGRIAHAEAPHTSPTSA